MLQFMRASLVPVNSSSETAALAWRRIDDEVVFLDPLQDRYFRLEPEANRTLLDAIEAGDTPAWHVPDGLAIPASWQEPASGVAAAQTGPFRIDDVARALWWQRRVERQLARRGFNLALRTTREVLDRVADRPHRSGSPDAIDRFVAAFAHASLITTAADRCLPRSLALALVLASFGLRCTVVLAVRRSPFAAHAWTQHAGHVLNETLEETRRYAPLLVL